MKRFLVFAGSSYYPLGGWDDMVNSFDTEKEALLFVTSIDESWYQIVDTVTGNILRGG